MIIGVFWVVGVLENEIGVEVTAVDTVFVPELATALGLSWVWAKTRPAPRTSKGVAKAMILMTLLLLGFGSNASACAIWNHSGLEFSGLMFLFSFLSSFFGQKVTVPTGRTLGTRLNLAE